MRLSVYTLGDLQSLGVPVALGRGVLDLVGRSIVKALACHGNDAASHIRMWWAGSGLSSRPGRGLVVILRTSCHGGRRTLSDSHCPMPAAPK